MIAVLVESIFGLWLALSILVHIPAFRSMRRWLNLDGLLPNWYLFTSQILMYDVCLRWREADEGQYGAWHDLPMVLPATPWLFLWNPGRRVTKALLDSADVMIQARLRGARERVVKSMPFKILLAWARLHAGQSDRSLQFCIALRAGTPREPSPQILFLSPVTPHNVPLD